MQKVVIITGASQGIGAEAVRQFAQAGWHVAALARRDAPLQALADELGADKVLPLACDVADYASVDAAVAQVQARWGRVDALINNAGIIEPIARLGDIDPADWARAVQINLNGVFHGMRAVLPLMKAQGAGTILNTSSGAAHAPRDGWAAYCSTKAGAAMLLEALHLEESAWGLRVMGLSPGTVATEMQLKIRASGLNEVSKLDPSVHVPADLPARCLLWMCSPASDPWLGQEISLRDSAILAALKES